MFSGDIGVVGVAVLGYYAAGIRYIRYLRKTGSIDLSIAILA